MSGGMPRMVAGVGPIVSVCGDAGGAAALVPVLNVLDGDGFVPTLHYAYREGVAMLRRAGVAVRELPPLDRPAAHRLLRDAGASAVLVATSCNGLDYERTFIEAARELGVASVAVLD